MQSVANRCFIIINLQLPVMDLKIMPEMKIIRHEIKLSRKHENLQNPHKFPVTKVSFYTVDG